MLDLEARRCARRRIALLVLATVATGAATAGVLVGAEVGDGNDPLPEASGPGPRDRTSFLTRVVPPAGEKAPAGARSVPRTVSELVRRLPLDRKVAQLFLLGFQGTDLTAPIYRQLRRQDLGGMVIAQGNYAGVEVLGLMAGEARVIAQQERHVPPWVMAVQDGAEFSSFSDLPPADAPADLPDTGTAETQAADTAGTLRPLGITGLLGPDVDVGPEDDPAVGARAYSDDPREVTDFAQATFGAYERAKLLSAAKHFPGLGSASESTELAPTQVGLTLEELRSRDLAPFRALFRERLPAVVLSHALYATDDFTVPGSLSKRIVTDLLREELGFGGVAITDDLADPAITAFSSVPDAAVKALAAGADMLYISGPAGDQQAAYVAVLRALRNGKISRERLDEAVGRILVAKQRYGLIR